MNHQSFFDAYRQQFGSLTQAQVDGLDFLLSRLDSDPPASLEQAAYMLATTGHETAWTYEPVKEAYWVTPDAEAWRKANLSYYPWYGRGYVQLTWEDNYIRAGDKLDEDLTTNPDDVMEPEIAYDIMLNGMVEGWFTGKKLNDYICHGKTDYVGARKIINGTDKASTIAGYAEKMATCLKSAGYTVPVAAQPLVCDLPTLRAPFGNTMATNLLAYVLGSTPQDLDGDVRAFQTAHGLTSDGIVGCGTWGAIYEAGQSAETVPPAGTGSTVPPPKPMGPPTTRPTKETVKSAVKEAATSSLRQRITDRLTTKRG